MPPRWTPIVNVVPDEGGGVHHGADQGVYEQEGDVDLGRPKRGTTWLPP